MRLVLHILATAYVVTNLLLIQGFFAVIMSNKKTKYRSLVIWVGRP